MNISNILEEDFSSLLEDLKNESGIILDIQLSGNNPTCETMRSGNSFTCNGSNSSGGASSGPSGGGK